MKKRYFALAASILFTGAVLFVWGAVIKYAILKPAGLGKGLNIIAAPLVYLTDDALRQQVKDIKVGGTSSDETPSANTDETGDLPVSSEDTATSSSESSVPGFTETSTSPHPQAPLSSDEVPREWYNDTLFIGASRTDSLKAYARSGNADYYSTVSMSVYNYTSSKYNCEDLNFPKQSLNSLLSSRKYRHIIIQMGINECGYNRDSLAKQYKNFVDNVRSKQPNAKLILEGIIAVSERAKAKNPDVFSPQNIAEVNNRVIASLADGTDVFYIDVNYAFTDGAGYLKDEFSPNDGIHFTESAAKIWALEIGRCVASLKIE